MGVVPAGHAGVCNGSRSYVFFCTNRSYGGVRPVGIRVGLDQQVMLVCVMPVSLTGGCCASRSCWGVGTWDVLCPVPVAASLGKQPEAGALDEVPVFSKEGGGGKGEEQKTDGKEEQGTTSTVAQQTSTLLSLLVAHDTLGTAQKSTRVWLGEGLGAIPKRVHTRMIKWEYVDMQDFRPRSASDQSLRDADPEKLVVLPGF